MKNRWLNLLFILTCVLVASLAYYLFTIASAAAAASLIINILKPLNILLVVILLYVVTRNLVKLYLGRRRHKAGFRLRTKLVLALLPITLAPAAILFAISTRFVDDVLLELVTDTDEARIITASERMRQDWLETVSALYRRHGDAMWAIHRDQSAKAGVDYLDRFGLDGVEIYENGRLQARLLNPRFPTEKIYRLIDTANPGVSTEPVIYDDGFMIARFVERRERGALHFIHTAQTPLTERFRFVRDSFAYLQQTQRKTEKLKGLNQGILLVVTLSVIFGGIWTGSAFAQRFLGAFDQLTIAAQKVSTGDFDTRVSLSTGDELEDVGHAFNSMTATLKDNQEELHHKARDLEQLNLDLSDQIHYNQAILRQINAGIVSVDMEGRIETHNPAMALILRLDRIETGAPLEEVLSEARHAQLLAHWRAFVQKDRQTSTRQLELLDQDGRLIYAASAITSLVSDAQPFGCLIVLEDLTNLLNAQKLAAWQEVARRVAHEIKNPLTPIQLSIQRVRRKAEQGAADLPAAIESAYETILGETNLLKNLVDEFSTFAKMPAPSKSEVDLAELVRSVVDSYKPVYPELQIETVTPPGGCRAILDPSQIRQVLSNLISNAAHASKPGDRIAVGVARTGHAVELSVADEGTGIPEAEREKIFLPYFSKTAKGTGLGLAIVKRIVEDHDGRIEIDDASPEGGARFRIALPD